MTEAHRVYFVPGMFGFGQLAGYDYFTHVRAGLEALYAEAGVPVLFEDIPSPPTSSLRERAYILAKTIQRSSRRASGPIHLVSHSTGGLDTRLVLAGAAQRLGFDAKLTEWVKDVRTAITISSPHRGTPLASYFATVSGTRVLYALSLLTVVSLSLGEPSLAIFSRLVATIGGIDSFFSGDLKLISRITDAILRFVDESRRNEIADFVGRLRGDQGAIIQITPEAMDLFDAGAPDHPDVRYACILTASPAPRTIRLARKIRSPYAALSAAMYSTLYQFTSQRPAAYRYSQPTSAQAELLGWGIEEGITDTSNDGIVPTLSMLHGELLWAGEADHLDILGHFDDDLQPIRHVDWMNSAAHFTRERFASLLETIARYQLDDT